MNLCKQGNVILNLVQDQTRTRCRNKFGMTGKG